ncbi:MAG: DUF805 domain-containing protein [Deltaproteobacteria bacterium]|nr:DUF805 domain-containing protein [Deltaproteobacteria bacterium]
MNYLIHALRNPFTYTGRASRAELWYFVLFSAIGFSALALLSVVVAFIAPKIALAVGALACVLGAGEFLVLAALAVRRSHDIGMPGWLAAVMFLVPPVFLVCGLTGSSVIVNRYGPPPHPLDFPANRVCP